MGAHCETLQSYAEDLALDAVLHIGLGLRKNLVQRVFQEAAVEIVVHGNVLASVVYPEVHNARIPLSLAHCVGYVAATLGMFNPEVAYALVRV